MSSIPAHPLAFDAVHASDDAIAGLPLGVASPSMPAGFGLDIRSSALLSLLPWTVMAIGSSAAGWLADGLIVRGMSVTAVRKRLQTVAFLGPALALTVLTSPAISPRLAVACMTAALGITSLGVQPPDDWDGDNCAGRSQGRSECPTAGVRAQGKLVSWRICLTSHRGMAGSSLASATRLAQQLASPVSQALATLLKRPDRLIQYSS